MVVHQPKDTARTCAAQVFCLFIILPIREGIRQIWPEPTTASFALREGIILACAAGLLLFVRRVEKLPFTSVGIGTCVWWKSALWGGNGGAMPGGRRCHSPRANCVFCGLSWFHDASGQKPLRQPQRDVNVMQQQNSPTFSIAVSACSSL